MPLRPMANRFGGCFCLGSGPVFWVLLCFLLFASLFPLAKRKSGWGICGSSFFFLVVWLWFSVLLLQSICRFQGPFVLVQCISCLLSCKDRAISATSATLEGKKNVLNWAILFGCISIVFLKKEKGGHMGDPWLACRTVQCKLHGLSPPQVFLVGGSRLERCQSTSRYGTCCCYAQSSR